MSVYTAILEQSEDSWGAYVPDFPGLAVGADTREKAELMIREGIVFHIEGLKARGLEVPKPTTYAVKIEVAV